MFILGVKSAMQLAYYEINSVPTVPYKPPIICLKNIEESCFVKQKNLNSLKKAIEKSTKKISFIEE